MLYDRTMRSAADRPTVGNWVIAGFAMAVVSGVPREDGRGLPVYGFGELLSLSPLLRWFS
ncbi:MAG: hypothetical protein ACYDCQ_05805 [Dehalococcoidia bacterium]